MHSVASTQLLNIGLLACTGSSSQQFLSRARFPVNVQTSTASVLHQQDPCLNIFHPAEKTSSLWNLDVVHEEPHDTAYPLFIAEKFLSSGLFAGPLLLNTPNLTLSGIFFAFCYQHISTLTSGSGLNVPHTWVGSTRR